MKLNPALRAMVAVCALVTLTACTSTGAPQVSESEPRLIVVEPRVREGWRWRVKAKNPTDSAFALKVWAEVLGQASRDPEPSHVSAEAKLVTSRQPTRPDRYADCLVEFSIEDQVVGILIVPNPPESARLDHDFAKYVADVWIDELTLPDEEPGDTVSGTR